MKKDELTITGRYQGSGRGFGFLLPDGEGEDCFIPPRREGNAWDGDRVEAALDDGSPAGRRTAHVLRVLERGNPTVTGTVRRMDRALWLIPDNERLPAPIKLTGKPDVRDGDKAAVSVTSYGTPLSPPAGTLAAQFGAAGTREASTAAILYRQGIQREFPPQVTQLAEAIPQTVPARAMKGRTDLRGELILTIDGAATKDIDDAVSLKRKGDSWVLGVHIADVSHYVTPGSVLDDEAFARGTSVYFADQVIPMLPAALSNGICSLNPHTDRLTLSCIMTLDKTGAVIDHQIVQSVIRSAEKMAYPDCNILLGAPAPAPLREELEARYSPILPMLRDMAALSRLLTKRRLARGSLDLDSRESAVVCDSAGRPVEVVPHTQGESEKLIESFMLCANETVAAHLLEAGWPGVFRVHEKPSQKKADLLRAMLSSLGLTLRDASGSSIQKVLDQVRGTPQAPAVSMMVLRSMMKARYSEENLGHFGVGAGAYCHFTSPIRRYPDLMVHRCLHALLEGKGHKGLSAACARAALQSSLRETAAQTAEWDIEKLYFAEYMQAHVGEEFDASVSGVSRAGLFAALSNGVEGFIPLETLPDDRYTCDDAGLTLTGAHTGAVYSFGMAIRAVCVSADPGTGRVELRLPGAREVPSPVKVKRKAPAKAGTKGKGSRPAMHVPKRRKGGRR